MKPPGHIWEYITYIYTYIIYYKHCLKYMPGTFSMIHNIITKIEIVILLMFIISKS